MIRHHEMTANARQPQRRRASEVPLRDRRGLPLTPGTVNPTAILDLQRAAGNSAVTALLEGELPNPGLEIQREIGWKEKEDTSKKKSGSKKKDAPKKGRDWNAAQQEVGTIHRIPLQGLSHGLQQEKANRWVKKTKDTPGHWVEESTMNPALSSESAQGRAIVLVPQGLNPNMPIDVLVHLHGYTETAGRPFAGWRALNPAAEKTTMRQGIDEDDVTPVRDVALDRAEQQLEESKYTQQMIVLPQGGLHSQFGPKGDYNFDSGAYVGEIVSRLIDEKVWKPAPKDPPKVRVSMAGHSGAGSTLAKMARESVNRQAGQKPGANSPLTGDLVIFDAINSDDQYKDFRDWALMRLDQDLAVLNDKKTEAEKVLYLKTSPKLRGYYSTVKGSYVKAYQDLNGAICDWFGANAPQLGTVAPRLRANFAVVPIPVTHEELMRGVPAGEVRAGEGGILDALRALHGDSAKEAEACAPATKAKPKPAQKPAAHKSREKGRSSPVRVRPTQAPTRAARQTTTTAKRKAPVEDRAQQIATAILLAKTGGEGEGTAKDPKTRAEEAAAAKEAAETAVAHDILKGTKKDVDAWFADFEPQATFLGKRIRASSAGEPPGVHHELAVKLKAAEDSLVNTKAGEKPADAAVRLGVKDIAGLRRPKTPTGKSSGASMHCFGLAVDIDHDNNPFVGNIDKPKKGRPAGPSIQIIEHATLLLGGDAHDPLQSPGELKDHQTDSLADRQARAARADVQWKRLSADSEKVRQYLSMTSEELDATVKDRLAALTAWQELKTAPQPAEPVQVGKKKKKKKTAAPTPPPWVAHVNDPTWWHEQHQRDIKQSMSGDFGHGKAADPKTFGFMTLREELVQALVLAGLSWGGTYQYEKDIMHFDLRTGSIGGRPVV